MFENKHIASRQFNECVRYSMPDARSSKRSTTKRKAFTLIELLVVISIMSMLMAILMPALGSAREQGKRVDCLSTLRQLTIAWQIYATDNDELLCSANTDWNDDNSTDEIKNHWVADGTMEPDNDVGGTKEAIVTGVLWPQTARTYDIYRCKTDRSGRVRSYSLSRTMNGKTCNCEHDNIKPFRTLGEIIRPTERLVFSDATCQSNWLEGSFCQVKDVEADPPVWFGRASRNITARHNDGCNISLADLHCEYWRWKDRRTVKLANWEIDFSNDAAMTAASEGNKDLYRMVDLLKGR